MPAVIISPAIVTTLRHIVICSAALYLIQPNWYRCVYSTEKATGVCSNSCTISKLTTNNTSNNKNSLNTYCHDYNVPGIFHVPVVITNCSPHIIIHNLNTSFILVSTTFKSNWGLYRRCSWSIYE